MTNGLDDYEVVAGEDDEAPDDSVRQMHAFPDPSLDSCPVVPLGFEGGRVIFAMPEGEIRRELASKIGPMLRTDIFACVPGWVFLTNFRDKDDKFSQLQAATWFVRQCRKAGLWDSRREIRSLGVWPGPAGAVVLHKGDEIWTLHGPDVAKPVERTSIRDAMRRRDGPLYRLRPTAAAPELGGGKAASQADGAWVREHLDCWRWEPIGADGLTGADVLAGWMPAAMLGAVAPFRGHGLLSALQGSGKTSLMFFAHALMSAVCGDVISSFSEAGMRADVSGEARPVLLDEAEGSPDGQGAVERTLEMLRRMSTGEGGLRKQADGHGGVTTQTAVGAVFMGAINAPKLQPADASRFVEVRLLPLTAPLPPGQERPMATDDVLQAALDRARELSPRLLGRVLAGAWRYRSDVAAIKAAMAEAGESPRTADLVAMLAAGRRLLLFDQALTREAALEEVDFWRPLLLQREHASVVSNAGADCLAHLFSWPSGQHHNDRVFSLGELVQQVAAMVDDLGAPVLKTEDFIKKRIVVLANHGLRVGSWQERPELMVANQHPMLEKIFARTKWQDWRRSLAYLDALGPDYETRASNTSQHFGPGVKSRGIVVPLSPWLEKLPERSGLRSDFRSEEADDS